MNVQIFQKKENRVSPYTNIGVSVASRIFMHIVGEEYAKEKDNEAEGRLSKRFGEILGDDHPEKVKLVKEAKKEVAQARREGELQDVVERICSDVLTGMTMAMITRRN